MIELEFNKYFDAIESYFALKRDQVLLLSPEEFEVVETFYNNEIKLKLVLKGIDLFFDKKKKRKRKNTRPYFLTHVKPEIEKVVKDYAKKGVGSCYAEGPTESQFIKEKINEILQLIENTNEIPQEISSTTTKKLKKVLETAELKTMEDIELDLDVISQFAREEIFDILNIEAKNEIDEEIKQLTNKCGKDIPQEVIDRFKMEIIFAKFDFPIISLFA